MKYILAFSTLLFAQIGHATNVYKFTASYPENTQVAASTRELALSGAKIIDSIPQLGIYVTETAVTLNSRNFLDLGEVKTISLITPNEDSRAKQPWGLTAIHANEAWTISTGAGVVVAVSDTGVDSNHPDLEKSMWRNPGEMGTDANGNDKTSNGIDDDNNGYVDDVFGWNFVKNKPSGKDNHYHGTHVSGTIAAQPTKKLSGVAPDAKIMDVSFLGGSGSGSEINGAKTIIYAADNGAKIINCSWGDAGKNQIIQDAILYAQQKGVLVVVAAGNSKLNTDRKPFFPSSIDLDNIVSVGATSGIKHTKASFSNYGATTVDVAAPGYKIYSTAPTSNKTPRYKTLSGTSMASPHVAGVAALLWSANPGFNWQQVKNRLLETTQPSKYWKKKNLTEGAIDAYAAVKK
ncbi:MAG: S8 family serine peptidase [Bdellovibrionales bacterium]|nr:S8 family serine peptidase [Bdellovibrionales bacterium]